MVLQALAFYVFGFVVMTSGAMVVVSRNPVYSVLFLILAFFNAAAESSLTCASSNRPRSSQSNRPQSSRLSIPRPRGVHDIKPRSSE